MQNYNSSYNSSPNSTGYGNCPAKPENYLVWAILEMLFCCMPLGIVGLIYSTQVDSLYSSGRYAEAETASQNAKKYLMWGLWAGLAYVGLILLFYIVYFIVVIVAVAANN